VACDVNNLLKEGAQFQDGNRFFFCFQISLTVTNNCFGIIGKSFEPRNVHDSVTGNEGEVGASWLGHERINFESQNKRASLSSSVLETDELVTLVEAR
jgi:hypothetical protein